VKYGSGTLEVAKGKNSVEVSSGAELVKALETLKLATESGELDTQLENAGLKHRNNAPFDGAFLFQLSQSS
jgi:hypothetical protein